jgi:hypothetical protein
MPRRDEQRCSGGRSAESDVAHLCTARRGADRSPSLARA